MTQGCHCQRLSPKTAEGAVGRWRLWISIMGAAGGLRPGSHRSPSANPNVATPCNVLLQH